MCPTDPFSVDPGGEPAPENDLSFLRTAARRLIDAIAAEPVPERLRGLAIELGRALDHQRRTGAEEDSAPQG